VEGVGVKPCVTAFRDVRRYEEQTLWHNLKPGLLAHLAAQASRAILIGLAPATWQDPELKPVGAVIDRDQQNMMVTRDDGLVANTPAWHGFLFSL